MFLVHGVTHDLLVQYYSIALEWGHPHDKAHTHTPAVLANKYCSGFFSSAARKSRPNLKAGRVFSSHDACVAVAAETCEPVDDRRHVRNGTAHVAIAVRAILATADDVLHRRD